MSAPSPIDPTHPPRPDRREPGHRRALHLHRHRREHRGRAARLRLRAPARRRGPDAARAPRPERALRGRRRRDALPGRACARSSPARATCSLVEPGVAHSFANAGADEARLRVEVRPALAMEEMFADVVELAEAGRMTTRGMPRNLLDLALLARTYDREAHLLRRAGAARHRRSGPAGRPGLGGARPARARLAGPRRRACARRQRAARAPGRARAFPQRRAGLARGRLRLCVRLDAELRRGRTGDAVTAARLACELEPRDGRAGQQRTAADRGDRRAGAGRAGDAAGRRALLGRGAALGGALPAHERGELRRDRARRDRWRAGFPGGRDGLGRHVAAGGPRGRRHGRGRDARAPPGRGADGRAGIRRALGEPARRAAARRRARELRAAARARPAGHRRLRRLPRLRDRGARRVVPGLRRRRSADRGVRPRLHARPGGRAASRRPAGSAAPRAG